MSLATAKEKMRELATKAQEVVADDTKSTADKRTELDKIEADVKAFSEEIALHEQAQRLVGGGDAAPDVKAKDDPERETRVKSVGDQVLDSDAYKAAAEAAAGRKRFTAHVDVKAVNTVDEGTTFSNGFPAGMGGAAVMPQYLPGIVELRFRKLLIADLFAQGTTSSNQISYVKETAFQNNAAGVAEKGLKPQSDDTLARVSEQVGKIAHWLKTTDELVQDAPAFRSFLQNRLVFGVRLKEDGDLLNATGYPSVNGLLNRTGMQTAINAGTTGTLADPTLLMNAIYQMVTSIRFNAFVEPDAFVINPTDWQNIRLAKDANKQYYGGGPFSGAYGNGGFSNVDSLWGLRAVITPAIASGTVLVGGYQECAQIFRRQGITVDMTNSDGTDFENNIITVRAEERLALAVYLPGGFGKVTVTWA